MPALRPGVIRRNKRLLDSRVTWRGVDWLVEHLCCGRRSWLSAASLDSQKRPSRCKLCAVRAWNRLYPTQPGKAQP